ncbi:acyltransferase family protein [Hymenobacter chitinivorans]|uniref:Acyltransferase-like protein n=1 Tax=Hymenobacter chitinivorans DSM 11115 TaxID=1121954 RepID=A0A2M9B566_9BACT|nr:acyltransferase [Hymenobacter chitinivorans]PJJ53092.1 acyltransferase-like protein [Hymenobacter chitinivorans DSM 11115]
MQPVSSPEASVAEATPARLDPFLSQKLRFWSLVAMVLLVYVHGYNLHSRYLQPWTPVDEPLSVGSFLQYFLANGLLRFRIPILFAISGYLFAFHDTRASHKVRVKRRVLTLLVPYLLWSALGLGFTWALEQYPPTRQLVLAAELSVFGPDNPLVSGYSAKELLLRWLLLPVPFQLWFLRSLLVYNLAYPWLRKAVLQAPTIYFGVAGLLWLLEISVPPLLEGTGLVFFALGIWLQKRDVNLLTPPRWLRPGVLVVVWLAVLAGKTYLAFASDHPPFIPMLLLHRAGEGLGVVVMWFGTDALVRGAMRQRWFGWLTGFSFMIYALHVPLVNYATEAALRLWPGQNLLVYLLLPLAVVALAVLLGAGLRRVAPAVYGLLTGGRGL